MTRLKRAQRAYEEADAAATTAFEAMGAAEVAWMRTKLETVPWGGWEEHDARRKACLRALRRARSDFRKHLRAGLEASKDIDRLTEDRERRQDVARRTRQRKQRCATVAGLAARAGAELTVTW